MKKVFFVLIFVFILSGIYSQDNLSLSVSTDSSFSVFTAVGAANIHLYPFSGGQNTYVKKSKNQYSLDFENKKIEDAKKAYAEIAGLSFDYSIPYDPKFNAFSLFHLGTLENDFDRVFLAKALGEYFGEIKINSSNTDSAENAVSNSNKEFKVKIVSIGENPINLEDIPIYIGKMRAQSNTADFDSIAIGIKANRINLGPGNYYFNAGSDEYTYATSDVPKFKCYINDTELTFSAGDKNGRKQLFFTIAGDYSVSIGVNSFGVDQAFKFVVTANDNRMDIF